MAALVSGVIAHRAAEVRERRTSDIATRTVPVTGVSEFPNLAERPLRWSDSEPGIRPDSPPASRTGPPGLPAYRFAEPFESYRDRSDAQLAATGSRPRAFLATLGPIADHTARAAFTRNLLHAGGHRDNRGWAHHRR